MSLKFPSIRFILLVPIYIVGTFIGFFYFLRERLQLTIYELVIQLVKAMYIFISTGQIAFGRNRILPDMFRYSIKYIILL